MLWLENVQRNDNNFILFQVHNQKNDRVHSMNPFPSKPLFLSVYSRNLLKTIWEKEKLLVMSNFSFSQCFLPIWRTFHHFRQTQNCRLQNLSVWKSLKFVVWERVNKGATNPLTLSLMISEEISTPIL